MRKRSLIVSFEGISGVGKTYLSQRLREECQDLPLLFQAEIPEWQGHDLGSRIVDLLTSSGDLFFRNGLPLTTTFLLLSLAMYREETKVRALSDGQILLKDRSIDSLAVYQAILLHPDSFEQQVEMAQELFTLLARWTTLPDLTFLIQDDVEQAIGRAEQRNRRAYRDDERTLLLTANRLYGTYAGFHTNRMVRIHRQAMDTSAIIQHIRQCILEKMQPVSAERERCNTYQREG